MGGAVEKATIAGEQEILGVQLILHGGIQYRLRLVKDLIGMPHHCAGIPYALVLPDRQYHDDKYTEDRSDDAIYQFIPHSGLHDR